MRCLEICAITLAIFVCANQAGHHHQSGVSGGQAGQNSQQNSQQPQQQQQNPSRRDPFSQQPSQQNFGQLSGQNFFGQPLLGGEQCPPWKDWETSQCLWPTQDYTGLPEACHNVSMPLPFPMPDIITNFMRKKEAEAYNHVQTLFKNRGANQACGMCQRKIRCRTREDDQTNMMQQNQQNQQNQQFRPQQQQQQQQQQQPERGSGQYYNNPPLYNQANSQQSSYYNNQQQQQNGYFNQQNQSQPNNSNYFGQQPPQNNQMQNNQFFQLQNNQNSQQQQNNQFSQQQNGQSQQSSGGQSQQGFGAQMQRRPNMCPNMQMQFLHDSECDVVEPCKLTPVDGACPPPIDMPVVMVTASFIRQEGGRQKRCAQEGGGSGRKKRNCGPIEFPQQGQNGAASNTNGVRQRPPQLQQQQQGQQGQMQGFPMNQPQLSQDDDMDRNLNATNTPPFWFCALNDSKDTCFCCCDPYIPDVDKQQCVNLIDAFEEMFDNQMSAQQNATGVSSTTTAPSVLGG